MKGPNVPWRSEPLEGAYLQESPCYYIRELFELFACYSDARRFLPPLDTRKSISLCWMLQSIGCALQRRVFLLCVFQAAACNKKYVIILIQSLSSPFCKYDQNKTTSADSICESESRFIAGICVPWHGSLCRKHPCVS